MPFNVTKYINYNYTYKLVVVLPETYSKNPYRKSAMRNRSRKKKCIKPRNNIYIAVKLFKIVVEKMEKNTVCILFSPFQTKN